MAQKTFLHDRLTQQTPVHLMTLVQKQEVMNLTAEISALKDELYCLMIMDRDI